MFENIDFGIGVIKKYIDFNVKEDIPLEQQVDLLKEDLLQVSYHNNYILDIGWYPEFDEEGIFRVSVIKDYEWNNPIIQKSCRDLKVLYEYVHECINFIQTKL